VSSLPAGTVTFAFTDIEGSTKLLQELGDDYAEVAREHRRIVRESFGSAGGTEIDTQGDAFFFSFTRARDAVRGAVDAQRALRDHAWPRGSEVRVRMGLHTGEPTIGDEGYLGMDVVRAARIASAGHGGQILLSETTRALVGNDVPAGASVHDLGKANLKDVQHEHIYELAVDGERSSEPIRTHQEGPKSAGEQLAERIHRHVEQQIEASLSGKPAEGKRLEETTVRAAASGLLILAMTLLTIAAVIIGIVLLVKLAF
jgi:class 3 adenylate cyclase